jgi:hypothetical protein
MMQKRLTGYKTMQTPLNHKLHCYAIKEGNQWTACCLDFTLAAQADSFEHAKAELETIIKEYVYDAVEGSQKEYQEQLLKRKAPYSEWVKYYYYAALHKLLKTKDGIHRLFDEPMPKIKVLHAHK